MVDVIEVDHPAAALQLAQLRDATTAPDAFRDAARRLGMHLATEALRRVPMQPATVRSPLGDAATVRPAHRIVAVPVLRAGLGLLDGVTDVVPDLRVGMIGLSRDEDTHEPSQYYRNVPSLDDAWVFVLEPMLATGGSAATAVRQLDHDGAAGVTVISVVATEAAVGTVADALPDSGAIVVGSVDPRLDENAFIVPGLGDFGDRLFGTV